MKALFLTLLLLVSLQLQSQPLFEYVKANNYNKVKAYTGAVNLRDENQATPIMWAAYKADLKMVKLLVKKGADLSLKGWILHRDTVNNYEFIYGSLMAIAAGENKTDLIRYFLKKNKIDVNDREVNLYENRANGWTALHWAAVKGNLAAAELLLKKGADINAQARTDFNQSPLILAINFDQVEVAKFIIDKGANVNQGDMYGVSVLSYAFEGGSAEIVKALVEHGARFNPIEKKSLEEELDSIFGVSSVDQL